MNTKNRTLKIVLLVGLFLLVIVAAVIGIQSAGKRNATNSMAECNGACQKEKARQAAVNDRKTERQKVKNENAAKRNGIPQEAQSHANSNQPNNKPNENIPPETHH